MDHITFYTINEELNLQEQGEITRQAAIETVDKYVAGQRDLSGSAGHVVSQSIFGFSLDKRTFIEISLDTEEEFRVKFETPEQKKLAFIKMPGLFQKEVSVLGKDALTNLVSEFFTLSCDEFKDHFLNL
jgi:hypothetical protein